MKQDRILLDHGSGGLASQLLIENLLIKRLDNPLLSELGDSALINSLQLEGKGHIAFSTDSYVVDPIFFPGGDIGELAVNGTVNDLAMVGARPIALSLGLILEEGFFIKDLEKIVGSIADACNLAGVHVITGDTKVVPKGKGDKVFINTSGIGVVPEGTRLSPSNVSPGDRILVSGPIGNHGITILTCRSGINIDQESLKSDTRPLNRLVSRILEAKPEAIHAMRDPTRGGLGTTLWEIARASGTCIEIQEREIPIEPSVESACEILGMDPLYLANEGVMIAVVNAKQADQVLEIMKATPEGHKARDIGRVVEGPSGKVLLNTRIGGKRPIEPLSGEPLPRIC